MPTRPGRLSQPRWASGTPSRTKGAGGYGGGYGLGYGGPTTSDAFGKRAAPTPWKLLECFKQIVYSCISLNAGGVCAVPLRLYAKKKPGKGKKAWNSRNLQGMDAIRAKAAFKLMGSADNPQDVEEVSDHPLLDLLSRPNKHMDGAALIRYMVESMDVVGPFFAEPVGSRLRAVKELWPLPAPYVQVIPDPNDFSEIMYYRFGSIQFEPDELIRIQVNDLRNPYLSSFSPTRAAYQYVGLEDEWVSTQRQVYEAGPAPSLIVSPKDSDYAFGPETRLRLETNFNMKHAGGGRGKVIVADGALSIAPISYPPNEVSETKVAEYDLERICNCFGVHPAQMSRDTNMANMEAANQHHAKRAIQPRCVTIAGGLTRHLASRFDDRLFFAFDSVVSADQKLEAEICKIYVDMGVKVINQVRAELGYDAEEWGDEPWMNSQLVQPSAKAEQIEHDREIERQEVERVKEDRLRAETQETTARERALHAESKTVIAPLVEQVGEAIGRMDERLRVVAERQFEQAAKLNELRNDDHVPIAVLDRVADYLRRDDRDPVVHPGVDGITGPVVVETPKARVEVENESRTETVQAVVEVTATEPETETDWESLVDKANEADAEPTVEPTEEKEAKDMSLAGIAADEPQAENHAGGGFEIPTEETSLDDILDSTPKSVVATVDPCFDQTPNVAIVDLSICADPEPAMAKPKRKRKPKA